MSFKNRQEAVEWIASFLEHSYPRAKVQDQVIGKLMLAFPKGVIPEFSEGQLIDVAAVFKEDDDIADLIKQAKTSPVAYDAVIARAAYELGKTGKITNIDVRKIASDFLFGFGQRPPEARGQKPKGSHHQARHGCIRLAIAMLESHGFIATRNQATSHRNSACDVVSDAMVLLKFRPQSFDEIKEICGSGDRVRFIEPPNKPT